MKAEVLVDWLTFSVKTDNPNDVIRDWLGMDPALFESSPYGFDGYLLSKRFSSIVVCFNGYPEGLLADEEKKDEKADGQSGRFDDMGVCVSMSGQGCRAFERYSSLGFHELFKKLVGNMALKFCEKTGKFQGRDAQTSLCNISRLDVACDERTGLLDMSLISRKAVDLDEFNSRMRNATDYRGKKGKEWVGHSVYIGSEKSEFRLRFYDKALEQKQKGLWKESVKDHWIRVEMVMKRENALGFILEALKAESVGKLAAQVLNEKFRFIERDDANISRCTVCEWWAAFVEEVGSVVIWSRMAIQSGIDKLADWLRFQVSSSMAVVFQAYGASYFYRHFIEYGGERLNRRQEALLKDFNAQRDASVACYQAAMAARAAVSV